MALSWPREPNSCLIWSVSTGCSKRSVNCEPLENSMPAFRPKTPSEMMPASMTSPDIARKRNLLPMISGICVPRPPVE